MPRKPATPTMLERARAFRENPDDPRHGTSNGYGNLKCRCLRCRAENARSHREWMNDPAHPERLIHHRQQVAKSRAEQKETAP